VVQAASRTRFRCLRQRCLRRHLPPVPRGLPINALRACDAEAGLTWTQFIASYPDAAAYHSAGAFASRPAAFNAAGDGGRHTATLSACSARAVLLRGGGMSCLWFGAFWCGALWRDGGGSAWTCKLRLRTVSDSALMFPFLLNHTINIMDLL